MKNKLIGLLIIGGTISFYFLTNGSSPSSGQGWAANLAPAKQALFLQKVEAYFQNHGLKVEINKVEGAVKIIRGKATEDTAFLDNIAAICAQLDPSEWDAAIADHFDKSEAGMVRQDQFEIQKQDFEQVKDLIHVRIYERGGYGPADVVAREALPGTEAILVYDLPETIQNVVPDDLKKWGKTPEEMFRLGLENVKKHYPPRIQTLDWEGTSLKSIEEDNFFNTTFALLMADYPELVGSHGALVGIPVTGILISHPINDTGALKVISTMVMAIHGFYKDGPRSTSDKLYWYHDGKFVVIPTEFEPDTKKVGVTPPDEFVEILNSLGTPAPAK